MSVINRMLSDLERRGAPSPQSGDQEMHSSGSRHRPRRPSPRIVLVALAAVLIVVAGALWLQRGERILAALESAPPVASEPTPAVQLVGVSFDRSGEHARLVLRVDGDMGRSPRFSRSGGSATLVVDAGSDDLVLPAPPREQAVFRGISLGSDAASRTRIHLEVAAAAELELDVEGGEIALLGRMPVADPVADGDDAADAVPASAGEASDPAASTVATGTAGTTDAAEPAEADAGPDASPSAASARSAEIAATEPPSTADERSGARPEPLNDESVPASASDDPPGSGNAVATTDSPPEGAAVSAAGNAGSEGTVRKTASMSPETRARRRYREGRDAVARGELATARRALDEALELDPSLHPARDLLVGLLRRAGETAAARRLLADGVERSPARVQYAMPYARLLVDVGELHRAAEVLEGARVNGTGAAGYHALVAAVDQRRGAHRSAATEYTRALEIRADNGLWWLGLGISLAALEKPEEARAAFREARTTGTLSQSLDRWAQGRIDELATGKGG
jgi:MSHA biogenesis protein MshN